MNHDQARAHFLRKPEAGEDFPFGPDVAVYKVASKMFGTLRDEVGVARMNLKCDPEEAIVLRRIFDAVTAGYHMNKRHWNTVLLDGSIPDAELRSMIDDSYALVVGSLKKSQREQLERSYGCRALYGDLTVG